MLVGSTMRKSRRKGLRRRKEKRKLRIVCLKLVEEWSVCVMLVLGENLVTIRLHFHFLFTIAFSFV